MEGLTVGSNQAQVERRSPAPKPRVNEAGQALLELALLLPILCLLVVGITDLGRAASVTIAVNNAATAGVEYGSQTGTTASDTNGMETAATNDTKFNGIPAGMTAAATHGCVCDTGDGASCNPMPAPGTCSTILTACPTGQIVECVQVVTQIQSYDSLLNFPGVPMSYQANGQAVMRVRH
jgi:Flp pilus assembly protein TadG